MEKGKNIENFDRFYDACKVLDCNIADLFDLNTYINCNYAENAGSNRFDLKKLVAYKIGLQEFYTSEKLLRHVVGFKFKKGISPEKIKEALTNFENLKNEIHAIDKLEWGLNNSTEGA